MRFLYALIIGAAAGFLAGQLTKGRGFGVAGNLMVGVVGALIGSLLFGIIGFAPTNLLGSLITATVGAIVLLWGIGQYKRLQ